MNQPPIRALLIDDEILARLALRQALTAHGNVDVVGECGNAHEAMQAMDALAPDLVFLDIRMPGMDGFRLLHELKPEALPMVVFATAFGEHALRAFDADAVDYILKPIDQARFDQAMTRVNARWCMRHAGNDADAAPGPAFLQRISVRIDEHIRVLATADIDWIGADGNYVDIHIGGDAYLHRETLGHLQAHLDPARFLRIHRSTIVNIERIREVHPLFNGNAEVVLHDDTHLSLSRRFRQQIRQVLGET
ncbi:MAG TPA: LytTR family transcriptional regulator DNA-binding domain-containing protein [Rhodanobacteraceae bacterium]|nr:LytTR family transcriptional regulator DNA-binding domain-containing protein [Rhodanobacteraceae bacterium]